MAGSPRPVFRELDPHEAEAMLSAHQVGRLVHSIHDRVAIEPLHYVCRDGWLYRRTTPGSKVTALGRHPWVARAPWRASVDGEASEAGGQQSVAVDDGVKRLEHRGEVVVS